MDNYYLALLQDQRKIYIERLEKYDDWMQNFKDSPTFSVIAQQRRYTNYDLQEVEKELKKHRNERS